MVCNCVLYLVVSDSFIVIVIFCSHILMSPVKPKRQLSADDKSQIVLLRMQELSCKDIARMFDVHESTIYRFCLKFDQKKNLEPDPRSGRPPKISARDVQNIQLCLKRNRRVSIEMLQKECSLQHVSLSTISRAIKFHTNFKNRFCKRKPFISIKNMRRRVLWCRQHLAWTDDDWKHVVWSDESPFTLRCHKRVRSWQLPDDIGITKCHQGTVKHDAKINVWGCFAAHRVGTLHKINGIMDKHMYLNILQTITKPSCEMLFPDDDYMLMQDNDPKHTAKLVARWIQRNINTIDWWPAQSPDLNPIENLWSILNGRCRNRTCNNETELFAELQKEWNKFNTTELTKLVSSMNSRMLKVLKAKGGPTDY